MPHGQPDHGVYQPASTIYRLADMGEIPVRLGSPVSHDRRGDVMWIDAFDSGLKKWEFVGDGTGNAMNWTAEEARNGGFSCQLICGSDGLRYAGISSYRPVAVFSGLGIEASIRVDTNIAFVDLHANLYDGANQHMPYIRYSAATGVWSYRDAAGDFQPTGLVQDLAARPGLFHVIKLVWDAPSQTWVRLIVDNHTVSLAAIPIDVNPSVTVPHLWTTIGFTGIAGLNAEAWVDDVIITQNEP